MVFPYARSFINNDVTGQGLLNLTVDDLNKLHVEKLGHQEVILEALEMLKNLVRGAGGPRLMLDECRSRCDAPNAIASLLIPLFFRQLIRMSGLESSDVWFSAVICPRRGPSYPNPNGAPKSAAKLRC